MKTHIQTVPSTGGTFDVLHIKLEPDDLFWIDLYPPGIEIAGARLKPSDLASLHELLAKYCKRIGCPCQIEGAEHAKESVGEWLKPNQ